jgi:hypothetical protein
MAEYKPPPAPPCLGAEGKSAWDKLAHFYEFTPGELQLLEQFCWTKDRVAALEEALADTGVMILGSRGQRTLNPVINQIAVQTTLMDRLMLSLALPTDYEVEGVRRSPQAQRAAKERWSAPRRPGRLSSIEGMTRGA